MHPPRYYYGCLNDHNDHNDPLKRWSSVMPSSFVVRKCDSRIMPQTRIPEPSLAFIPNSAPNDPLITLRYLFESLTNSLNVAVSA